MEVAGGSVKIIDPTNFPIAAKFSAALVTVKPGAIREIHCIRRAMSGTSSSLERLEFQSLLQKEMLGLSTIALATAVIFLRP